MPAHPTPRVAIIVPVYNLGGFLPAAVESALAQTVTDFEIVIIDDGSTDADTIRVVDGYADLPQVTVLRTGNHGVAHARNHGIAASSCPYIVPLDADDRLDPRFLEHTLPVLEQRSDVGFVYTSVRVFGEYEAEWEAPPFDLPELLARNLVGHATALVRRAAWENVGGYAEFAFEDWEFWIRLAGAGWRGAAVPESLVFYRKRPGSRLRRCEDPAVRPECIRLLIERNRAIYERHFTDVVVRLSQRVFTTQEAERRARFELQRLHRSRLGRMAGWLWAFRQDPAGVWTRGLRRLLRRPARPA